MTYSHWIVDTQTGVKQRLVRPMTGTWARGLNAVQSGEHSFRLSSKLTWQQWNDLFDGWRRMLVVCWNDVPVYAGFIVRTEYDYFRDVLKVSHASFRAVLARRFAFGIGGYAMGTLVISDQTARGIIYQLLFWGTQTSPSPTWQLRLRIPVLSEPGALSRTLYNFAFQTIEKGVDELSRLDNGPEVDFHPYWDANGALEHVALVGGPKLGGPSFEFNASASKPGMMLRTMVSDFTQQVTGIFALGKGSGEIRNHGEAATVSAPGGYISLDSTRTFGQIDDVASLNSHAAAEVENFKGPIHEWNGTVLADRWLPTALPGSGVRVFHKKTNWRPAEFITRRAVAYSGDITSKTVELEMVV